MYHFPKPFYRKSRQLWYVQVAGKQVNLGPDREEAFRQYHQMMASSEPAAAAPAESPQLVAELCDRYLAWVAAHRSPKTYEGYQYRLQRFIDCNPKLTVDALRPYHVQEWVDRYTLSPSSCRSYMGSVKTCLRWCSKQGYIDKNPLQHMEMPAMGRRDQYVSPEEFERVVLHMGDSGLRDLFVVTYEVGCRPQESLRVERRHVELEHQRWVFPIAEAKGNRVPRIVYLTEKAMEITRRLMLLYPEGPLFRNRHETPWTPDTVNSAIDRVRSRIAREEMQRRGETISDEAIEAIVRELAAKRKSKPSKIKAPKWDLRSKAKQKLLAQRTRELVPRYSLYALRHSWATNALKRGVDSLTVAILMGHQDPSMLAKVYQHLSHNPEHLLTQAKLAAR